jgi:putative transposase
MPRSPRFFTKGHPRHILQRRDNREPIFGSEPDFLFYLDCLERAADQHGLSIHAYVPMTNHVHLLASPSDEASAPKALQSVGRRYVQYFNNTYHRTGDLWEGRYRSTVVETETYLLTCMRYIELNPVRAGMVEHPAEHPWSSYRGNALGQEDSLLTTHGTYRRLGRNDDERHATYRQLFRSQLPKSDVEAIRAATKGATNEDELNRV